MKANFSKALALCSAIAVLSGCGGGSSNSGEHGSVGQEKNININFDYQLTAVSKDVTLEQIANAKNKAGAMANSRAKRFSPRAWEPLVGKLNVTESANQSLVEDFFWSSEIDVENFEIQSTRTIVLDAPDDYDFRLTLEDNGKKYYGERIGQNIIDGENQVLITLKPVIGDTTINTEFDNFCRYNLKYPAVEFENMLTPRFGVKIDGGSELFFDINKDTGSSVQVLSALQEGDHQLEFRLYDGNTAVGRTTPEKIIDVQVEDKCQNLDIDFAPFHGETVLKLDLEKGSADFTVNILADIVNEVEGDDKLSNFGATIQLSGELNTPDSTGYIEKPLVVTPDGQGDYVGTVTLDNLRFEKENNPVSVTLTFTDTGENPAYILGTCSFEYVLSESDSTQLCTIDQLNSRRIISGNILGVLGINVYDKQNNAIQGAVITANAINVGQTGTIGQFGTDGYLKMLLKKGDYHITATKGNLYDEIDVSIDSLDVLNDLLFLEPMVQGFGIGTVKDALTGALINGATVVAKQGDNVVAQTSTNVQGGFELGLEPGTYTFEFVKDGYLPVMYQDVVIVDAQDTILQAVLSISNDHDGAGDVSGFIINAVDGNELEGVQMLFRKGINAKTGLVQAETTTAASGSYSMSLEAGHYTAQLIKAGFADNFISVIAIGGQVKDGQNGSLIPVISDDEMRIVLSWGPEPADLDSHLYGPMENGSNFHVFYGNRKDSADNTSVELDRDDTDGYGPETTTIYQQWAGVYTFKVFDYRPNTEEGLANSSAKVTVYRGGNIIAEFNAPAQNGTLWTVFEMDDGAITPINVIELDDPVLRAQARNTGTK